MVFLLFFLLQMLLQDKYNIGVLTVHIQKPIFIISNGL